MTLPEVDFGTAADETALIAALATLAAARGWTTWTSSTTPSGFSWFKSTGEDGESNICGAFGVTTSGRMRAAAAVDIDTTSIVSASVGGYTNNDAAGVSTRVQAITPNTTAAWATRDPASAYTYMAVASLDSIACCVEYLNGGIRAQGVLYLGKTTPCMGRYFQTQAKAKIDSVGAGSNANQRLVTLDRDITAMLKDPATYPSDVGTQRLFFQPITTNSTDFAMVQRLAIVSGTLTTTSGQTEFEINVAGVKLAVSGGRYHSNRGAGDLVRIMNEPNVCLCGGAINAQIPFTSTGNTILSAWDNYGGQSAALDCVLENVHAANDIQGHDPTLFGNRGVPYRLYLSHQDNQTGLITQSDGEGLACAGVLVNAMSFPEMSAANFSYARIDGRAEDRWRLLERLTGIGIGSPIEPVGRRVNWAIGPGW
jgi:hypothetical protein